MKSLRQIALPIALVVGLVFGATFISNYTTTERNNFPDANESVTGSDKGVNLANLKELPLAFALSVAERKPETYYLREYKTDYEVGEPGSFDFWFANRYPSTVNLTLESTSCQCTSAEVTIVPMSDWSKFQQVSALASLFRSGGINVGSPLAGMSLLSLTRDPKRLPWRKLGTHETIEIPAADEKGRAQMGIFRLNWEGKAPTGPKRLRAALFMGFPNMNSRMMSVEAVELVTPPFRVYPLDLSVGSLGAGESKRQEFTVFSTTREPGLWAAEVSDSRPHPNVVISPGVALTDTQLRAFEAKLKLVQGKDEPPIQVRSAYQFAVEVTESKAGQQLDLGPIDRRLIVKATKSEDLSVVLKGITRGEVRIVGAEGDNDLIDLGQSFASNRERVREVRLVADRPDVELTLLKDEIRPEYLDVSLESLGMLDGKKTWKLRTRVPASKLFGSLPADSTIVLKVGGASERRVRIPVRGRTFDSSGTPSPF